MYLPKFTSYDIEYEDVEMDQRTNMALVFDEIKKVQHSINIISKPEGKLITYNTYLHKIYICKSSMKIPKCHLILDEEESSTKKIKKIGNKFYAVFVGILTLSAAVVPLVVTLNPGTTATPVTPVTTETTITVISTTVDTTSTSSIRMQNTTTTVTSPPHSKYYIGYFGLDNINRSFAF